MTVGTTPSLTLYLLCQFPQRPMFFAPHGWKAILPLRYLGVDYETVYVTLAELRSSLPKRLGVSKVTLPTLVVREQGGEERILIDSYNIAQYLETTFGSPAKTLFAGDVGRHFSRFIEQWVDRSLATGIRLCVLHTSYATFPADGPLADLASKDAFLAKCGQARMDELTTLNSDEKWVEERFAEVRKELGTLEALLKDRADRSEEGHFLGGITPVHADYCVYAFYPYSRTNTVLVEQTWHHKTLPYVQRWLAAMEQSGLVEESELVPL